MKKIDFETVKQLIKSSGIVNFFSDYTSAEVPLLVSGVPDEWRESFLLHGFHVYAQYRDYWLEHLIPPGNQYGDYERLHLNDCVLASEMTTLCQGQSRGFEVILPEWFALWVRGEEAGQVASSCKNPAVLLQKSNGNIIGISCTSTYAHDSEKGAVVWIRALAVHPDFQGKGIGQRLLMQTLQYGAEHGAKRAFLHVDTANTAAVHIYANAGFYPREGDGQIDMIWRQEQK